MQRLGRGEKKRASFRARGGGKNALSHSRRPPTDQRTVSTNLLSGQTWRTWVGPGRYGGAARKLRTLLDTKRGTVVPGG